MFYIIGLGLSDEKDITLRGLEVVRFLLNIAMITKQVAGDQRVFSSVPRIIYQHTHGPKGETGVFSLSF